MKKSLILSVICCSFIYGTGFVHPLPMSARSTENGGTLSAIDAYQDGVGAMVTESGRGIDNSAMNTLVFKYGNEAKDNGVILGDQVLLNGTAEDKLLAGKLYADGVTCNDGNDLTQGETWLNGICQGGSIPNGTSCIIANKIGSTYLNEVCQGGTWTNNGTPCDDGNSATTGETWLNGVCQGGILDGTSCIIANKTGTTYLSGVCQGGTWTNNGTACDDGNAATINETWLNGVCQGGIAVNTAGNGLKYDNCEGGGREWAAARNYCVAKGMRLAVIYSETGTGKVPSCPSGWTWSSTAPSYGAYSVWSGTASWTPLSGAFGVRCVK